MTAHGDTTTTTDSSQLDRLQLRDLIQRLATRDPVPGGGSAAAIAGAMGSALVSMVCALTRGRTETDAVATELDAVALAAAATQSDLLNLATLDASAYQGVVTARRLPRETHEERRFRSMQVEHATRQATEVPLRTARAAQAVLDLAERLVPIGSRHAISDVGVAAHLAAAAVRGGVLNVRINLPFLPDIPPEDILAGAREEVDQLLSAAAAAEARIGSAVAHRMEG